MLKGVNKQIIEITDTGNLYIKKAILFVDPEKRECDNDFLIHQGKKFIKEINPTKESSKLLKPKKTKKMIPTLIKLSAGIAIGATAASLIIR